ncbi:MAG: hypothetical protein M1440_11575 [Gammaproteobacteria bacterium]|nr:hypothetical protein [Gammaproteobacteria bacterium]
MTNKSITSKPYLGSVTIGLMIFYFYFSSVFLPLLSPLRNLEVLDPGLIRNALLPPLFIALVFSIGLGRVLKPRSGTQFLLVGMFLLGSIVGVQNIIIDESYREYFSHLFQVSSAYVMFLVGWLTFKNWSEKFWKHFILLALISALISSALTIGALDRGEIGRYYTAAYGFILISAYAANSSSSITLLAVLGSVVSNKRAVVLAIITMLTAKFMGFAGARSRVLTYRRFISFSLKFVFFALVSVATVLVFVAWVNQNPTTGVSKAYNISVNRMIDVVDALQARSGLEEAASGRYQEIEIALGGMNEVNYFIGSGAGWNIQLENGKNVQNIHFSPLSIAAVYGFPIAISFYAMIIFVYLRFVFIRRRGLTLTERMAPLYVLGALVHSFFAYSLFIDWLFFFFIGVMSRSVQFEIKSRGVYHNA